MNDEIYILAIETSCDDTSIAVMRNNAVLSNIVSSQQIHELFGGVVPWYNMSSVRFVETSFNETTYLKDE
jgi:tRNA A37 threonylcarbamoyltransferase TsaD